MEDSIENSFITRLRQTCADRGNRAALRRYWSPTTRHQAYPLLGQLGALQDERKTLLVALYAEHPEEKKGQTVGKAAFQLGDRKDGEHPYDGHFRRLLASAGLEELAVQLHRLVKRLAREGIGLDYELLYKNLNYWKNYSEETKVRWAADFWQAPIAKLQEESIEA